MPIPANKAIVGTGAFAHSSGIHQDGVLKNRENYEIADPGIYRPEPGATEPDFPLRPRGVKHRMEEMGYQESDYNSGSSVRRIPEAGGQKRPGLRLRSGSAGLYQQAAGRARAFPPGLLQRQSGSSDIATASIKLVCGDEIKTEAANGNGPVDAIYQAINRVTDYNIELVKYGLSAKGHGKDALGGGYRR